MKLELPRFNQAQVLVAGDVMLDRYWHGGTSRISPEAPVPVVNINHHDERPGGAANVALNIAALGANAALIGATGDDENARSLQTRLDAVGVVCDFQVSEARPTITKLRVISQNQQLIRLDFEEGFLLEDVLEFPARLKGRLESAGALILSDYGKGALQEPPAHLRVFRPKRRFRW